MRSMAAVLLVAGVLVAGPPARAATADVYVSPSGSDAAAGTASAPVKTLARARALARGKTATVHLASGAYRLSAPLALDSGDSDVVWQGTGHSVISGGVRVTGWTSVPGRPGLYSAPAPAALTATRQLYVNGVRADRARGPAPVTLTATDTGYTASAATMAGWRNPSGIEFVYTGGQAFWNVKSYGLGGWTEPRCPVGSISGTTITMAQPCWNNSTKRVVFPDIPGRTVNMVGPGKLGSGELPAYVENAYELLGTPGQFYFDQAARRIYYTPRTGENLATADVEAPVLEKLVTVSGAHDVAFRGIQFSYATWLTPSTPEGFSEIQAGYTITGPNGYATQGLCQFISGGTCPYASWTPEPANVAVTGGTRIEFSGDVFAHLGAAALSLTGGTTGSLVKGNDVTDISGNGLEIGGVDHPTTAPDTGNTIADNYLHGLPREFHGGVGILNGYTQGDTITHNQLSDLSYSGISMGWGGWPDKIQVAATPNASHDNTVSDNLIFNHMRLLDDGGAVYTQGITGSSLATGEKVTGNVAHDQFGLGKLIYTDNGCTYETVQGNVLYRGAYFNVGTRHTDYRDSLGNNDPTLVSGNYWEQGDADSDNKGLVTTGNHILSTPSAAPSSIVSAAGLEPAYRGLLSATTGAASVPEPPQRVAAFGADGAVYAAWNPVDTATSYVVSAGGKSATVSRSTFESRGYARIGGLTNGTAYTVTVRAVNATGAGPASLPSASVTPAAGTTLPAAPTGLKAYRAATAVSLHWTPPTSVGSTPVIGYRVTVSDGRTITVTGRDVLIGQPAAKDMTRVVSGLTSGTAYTITVAAVTATGTGPGVTVTTS